MFGGPEITLVTYNLLTANSKTKLAFLNSQLGFVFKKIRATAADRKY